MNFLKRLNIITGIFAAFGLLDSLYLTWVKLSHHEAACLPGIGNCEVVNTSKYSAINGMPIAVLGAGAYLLILAVLYLESRNRAVHDNGPMIIFGLSLIGVLYSAYLTYLELAIIKAICPFCVVSAIAMVLIFAANLIRLIQNQAKAHH